MKRKLLLVVWLSVAVMIAVLASPRFHEAIGNVTAGQKLSAEAQANRNPDWAVPVNQPDLPNLYQLTPTLYRGAQPTAAGMKQLEAMGIKTVINLRWLHSDKDEAEGTSLNLVSIPCQAWDKELDEQAVRFLETVTDPANQPVFVHCQHGADRTGTMCAIYRIVVQGWSVDAALEEMTAGGYNFHAVWKNLPAYLRSINVDALRKDAGLDEPEAAVTDQQRSAVLEPAAEGAHPVIE